MLRCTDAPRPRSRGHCHRCDNVCAQPAETAELVEHLEDAQMALGGMASSRYAAPFREQVASWLGKLDAVGEQVRIGAPWCVHPIKLGHASGQSNNVQHSQNVP